MAVVTYVVSHGRVSGGETTTAVEEIDRRIAAGLEFLFLDQAGSGEQVRVRTTSILAYWVKDEAPNVPDAPPVEWQA